MAGPGPAARVGLGLGLKYENCVEVIVEMTN